VVAQLLQNLPINSFLGLNKALCIRFLFRFEPVHAKTAERCCDPPFF